MSSSPMPRLRFQPLLLATVIVVLSGCATTGKQSFETGNYVDAVRQFEDASVKRPGNVKYRQRFLLKKQEALERIFRDAERARQSNDLSRAESLYQTALQIEPGNAAAREWLQRLNNSRRHNEQLVQVDEMISAGNLAPAERLVREVLAEAPDDLRAQNSLARIRAATKVKKRASDDLDGKFKKPVTLEFRDVPVKVAFEVLSKVAGINFVYDQDIRPDLKVTVFLRETPLDEAIRMIGLSTQLETRALNGNSMLVYPSTPQKISDYRQLSVRSFYLANADAKKVAETLKTILKTENIIVDEKLNLLVMRDSPDAIRLAEKLIALQDIAEPEVMLDVEILEIKHSAVLDMGIGLPNEVGISVVPPGQTSNAIPISDLRLLNSSSLYATIPNATIKLRDEGSDAKILANPKIRVKSKEKASVLIGDRVPVITSTSTSTGFVSETVNYVEVGLKLEVEPSVYAGDEVSIKINLEVSNLVREITTRSGTLSYQIGTRNAQTVLRLKDGETQILAGLINKEDRRVSLGWPGLSRFPVLNRIFGTQKDDKQNTEIVLSITPRLIRGVRRADLDELEFESGTATNLRGRSVEAAVEKSPAAPTEATADGSTPAGTTVTPLDAGASVEPAANAAPIADANAPTVLLDWSAPAEVRAGEQFTAVLNISALKAIDQLPVMIGFDPKVLQVVSVEEGTFMSQGGGQSSLTKQVNLSDGRVVATAIRQGTAVSGQGGLLQINFKALASAEKTQIQVLSATPGPAGSGSARLATATMTIR